MRIVWFSMLCGCSLSLDLDGPPTPIVVCQADELCNGIDDDCDNRIDEETDRRCYTGPEGTLEVGACRRGQRRCLAEVGSGFEVWSACEDEVLPVTETCNGRDDDCDGAIDATGGEAITQACFPFDEGAPGVGRCRAGKTACGEDDCQGAIGPVQESLNDVDDDCDGRLDED